MRKLIWLAFMVFLALPAFALKGMTVEQLERPLTRYPIDFNFHAADIEPIEVGVYRWTARKSKTTIYKPKKVDLMCCFLEENNT